MPIIKDENGKYVFVPDTTPSVGNVATFEDLFLAPLAGQEKPFFKIQQEATEKNRQRVLETLA